MVDEDAIVVVNGGFSMWCCSVLWVKVKMVVVRSREGATTA
jgi:hypothetical protein